MGYVLIQGYHLSYWLHPIKRRRIETDIDHNLIAEAEKALLTTGELWRNYLREIERWITKTDDFWHDPEIQLLSSENIYKRNIRTASPLILARALLAVVDTVKPRG